MTGYRLRYALAIFLLAGFLALSGVKAASNEPMSQKRKAEIINSGSTNAAGYQIVVDESGHAKYIPGKGRHGIASPDSEMEMEIPAEMVGKFFADIDRAGPLSKLPVGHCMKSASFGTMTFVKVGDDQSPDLSCTDQDPRMDALYKDVLAIHDLAKLARWR
jgi:hypothetical protein